MSQQEVYIIATMTPKPEKLDRCKEALRAMVQTVHAKEENTYRYLMNEQIGAKEGEVTKIIMVETYKDNEAADQHLQSEHFQALFKIAMEEEILAEEPVILRTVAAGGFDRDRVLL